MISGLVVHLSEQDDQRQQFLETVAQLDEFELGRVYDSRLPLVLATKDAHEAHAWTDWLQTCPAVVHADVTFVSFEDDAIGRKLPDTAQNNG